MSENGPGHHPEGEETVEFDEAEAWEKLIEIARELLSGLPEEELAYLAGIGIDMSKVTNPEGTDIGNPREFHTEDLFEALGQLQALAAQYGVEDELALRLDEIGIF